MAKHFAFYILHFAFCNSQFPYHNATCGSNQTAGKPARYTTF
jgi:hypothetical protein